jgi:hypothetical protein
MDDMDDLGKQLRAKMDESWQEYREFGQWKGGLKFDRALPLESPAPTHAASGKILAEGENLVLKCVRAPTGLAYFFLNDRIVPVGIFVHERSYISTLKEQQRKDGFDWCVSTPSFDNLVSGGPAKFYRSDIDNLIMAKFYEDIVVHSAGITTTVYLAVDTTYPSLEIQCYEDFSG